jgi:hypothetical protein
MGPAPHQIDACHVTTKHHQREYMMSTTTITQNDQPEIFDHEIDEAPFPSSAPRTAVEGHDRMLDYVIAESREQRTRERRREAQRIQTYRRRTRAAVATGTMAIVIAVGGTLFFIEGPSHGTSPQSSGSAPATAIQPASGGSQIPSGTNTGNMGSNGGPLNVPVSQ